MTQYFQKSKKIYKNNHCYAKVFSQDTFGLAFSYAKNEKFKKQYQDIYEYLIKIAVPVGHNRSFNKNGRIYDLTEGQCITTSSTIEKETGVKRSVFRKLIEGLKSEGILEIETNRFFTKITFLNFKERQKANSKVNFDVENYNYELDSLSINNEKTIKSPPIIKEIENSSKEEKLVTNELKKEEKDLIQTYDELKNEKELKDVDIQNHKIISKEFKDNEKERILAELKRTGALDKLKSKDVLMSFKKAKLFNFKGKYLTFSLFLRKLKEWFLNFFKGESKIQEKEALKQKIEDEEKTNISKFPNTEHLNHKFHKALKGFLGTAVFESYFKNVLICGQDGRYVDIAFPSERCRNSYFLHYKYKVDKILYKLGFKIRNESI